MSGSRSAIVAASGLLGAGLLFLAAAPAPGKPEGGAKPAAGAKTSFPRDVLPVVKKYCATCHRGEQGAAGLALEGFTDEAAVLAARPTWERVLQHVSSGHMPPKNAPQPSKAERQRLAAWIDAKLFAVDCNLQNPGRVTLRRLNRAEYNNTIRDLLGVDFRPADDFPSDDVGYGYDNIGDVLSLSPILMEKYLAAAEKIVRKAVAAAEAPLARFEAERIPETGGQGLVQGRQRVLNSNGEVTLDFDFPKDGEYVLRVRAYGEQAGDEPAKMILRYEGKDLQTVDVAAVQAEPKVYEVRFQAQAGKHRASAAFTNDFYNPRASDRKNRDRNLAVDYLEIGGPLGVPRELPESHRRVFFVQPTPTTKDECARKILGAFAKRAYRRPPAKEEVERLVRVAQLAWKQGDSFEEGIQLGLQAALVSPHFLFRVELDSRPGDSKSVTPLEDYALASRLSYFLWSSMPDAELFALAEKKQLGKDAVLEAQALRMLKDPKASALVENFAGQWLQLRNLETISPDPARFPQFNDELRAAMRKETELFFQAVMREDRSLLDLLDGKFTFLNERLAKHYSISGITGPEFRRVELDGAQRGGILTQASILTITSNPTRTSPVKRGKWIMEQILGTSPPPPPPNVPELKEEKDAVAAGSLRQRLEQHRADPGCASCHNRMDPLGFALENYDAVGAWREKDGTFPIDASGTMPDGKSFSGPAQLKTILKADQDRFAKAFTQQMLTYALGRGMEFYDRCAVDRIESVVRRKGYRFSALVTEVVKSDPFRMRKGEEVER